MVAVGERVYEQKFVLDVLEEIACEDVVVADDDGMKGESCTGLLAVYIDFLRLYFSSFSPCCG